MVLFLGPNIKELDVNMGYPQPSYTENAAALAAIQSECPHLYTFAYISGGELGPDITKPLTNLAGSLHALRWFHCGHQVKVGKEVLAQLALLPALKRLNIAICEPETLQISSTRENFPHLENLCLFVSGLALATGFMGILHTPAFKEVDVDVAVENVPPSSSMLRQFFVALHTHCIPRMLTHIAVHQSDDQEYAEGDEYHVLDAQTIESLMEFPNLQAVKIGTCISIERVDDGLLKRMVSAWPDLRTLNLATFNGRRWPSKVTISGLMMLSGCPNLHSLSIGFDARMPNLISEYRPGMGVINAAVSWLDAAQSPITHPRALAAILSDIFPNLHSITAWTYYDEDVPAEAEQRQHWMEVSESYRWFTAIRNQERKSLALKVCISYSGSRFKYPNTWM